jgi:orotate phosphoribosyltransferase
MERGQGDRSAVQEVRDAYGIPVVAIATLDDVMRFIAGRPDLEAWQPAVSAYRAQYGAAQPGVERCETRVGAAMGR